MRGSEPTSRVKRAVAAADPVAMQETNLLTIDDALFRGAKIVAGLVLVGVAVACAVPAELVAVLSRFDFVLNANRPGLSAGRRYHQQQIDVLVLARDFDVVDVHCVNVDGRGQGARLCDLGQRIVHDIH